MALLGSVPAFSSNINATSTAIPVNSGDPLVVFASLPSDVMSLQIFNTTGSTLALYTGENINLKLLCYIPGLADGAVGLERQPIALPRGIRLSVRSAATAVSTGSLIINAWV